MRVAGLIIAIGAFSTACAQEPSPLGGTPQIDVPTINPIFNGRIVLADGTPLPAQPQISSNCGPPMFSSGGHFTYQFLDQEAPGSAQQRHVASGSSTDRYARICLLHISLPGFRSVRTHLSDGMVIVLKRLGDGEGSAVSFSSLKAPQPAVKEFHRGHLQLYRKDYKGAARSFDKAVQIYPEYASAWDELGLLHEREGKPAEAARNYEKAVEIDARYVRPLYHLARLASEQGRWQDAIVWSEQALALNPVEFPGVYLANAIAGMNLGRSPALVERNLRRAAELDIDNQLPRAYYLLGVMLAGKGDRPGAIASFENYILRTRDPAEIARARQRIADLQAAR